MAAEIPSPGLRARPVPDVFAVGGPVSCFSLYFPKLRAPMALTR